MKLNFKKTLKSKRFIYLSLITILATLSVTLNLAFSAFTNRSDAILSNIKVAGMDYSMSINGKAGQIITAENNDLTKSNIIINSLNKINSKYELIYKVCTDTNCNNEIAKPKDLLIEYSSRTTDAIFGAINSEDVINVRVITTNNTNTTYYIKFDINAGYIHNTLALQNLITTEYNEEDITIAAIIDGEISTTFPTTNNYSAVVTCQSNDGPSNATGTATWNGSKWVVNITGADTGRTVCNVEFKESLLRDKIIAQGGGVDAIVARGTPDFSQINGTSGIYAAQDDYGTSYYYRGLKTELNNNLIWAGFQWKIVRVNGDGSIRIVYNGTEAQFNSAGIMNSTGTNTQIGTSAWNTSSGDAKYLGYMFGGANGVASTSRNGTGSLSATYNQTNTTMKTTLDNWYKTNIYDKGYNSQVVDNLFCNDRQLQTGPGYGSTLTYYAARHRLSTNKSPTLKCGLKNDRFTVNDLTIGNGALTYPVGLLTADEASIAGLLSGSSNSTNYLHTNQHYWLFSPSNQYSASYTSVFYVYSTGNLYNNNVENSYGVRCAVSLDSKTPVSGSGSSNDPFRA